MGEVVVVYCKEINDNGDGTMFFQDIRREVDNSGAGNRGWGNTLGLPLKQFGKWAILVMLRRISSGVTGQLG